MSSLPGYKRNTSRKRVVDRSAIHFAPYFDFGDEPEETTSTTSKPSVDPLKRIAESCQSWTDIGNQVIRYGFGVKTKGFYRLSDKDGNIYHTEPGTYQPSGEQCCPLGLVLIDTESHFMPLLDAAKVLEVDEYWITGFIHGVDKQNVSMIGRNLEKLIEHESYLAGREAGWQIAARFIKDQT